MTDSNQTILNKLIYTTIRDDHGFKSLVGGTDQDPRIYKGRTPTKVRITELSPGYCVYYLSGTTDPGSKIYPMQLDNHGYIVEVYGKSDILTEDISTIINDIFKDKQFTIENLYIKHSYSSKGINSWDDNRVLYFQTVRINLETILDNNL
jgi:hypothetical protein